MSSSLCPRLLLLASACASLAIIAPGASARPRVHRSVTVSKHCTVKRSRRTVTRHCVTHRLVRVTSGSSQPSAATAPQAAPHAAQPSAQAPAPGGPSGASTSSSGCADTGLVPSSADLDRVAAATLCLVNQQRASSGERPLSPDAALSASAQAHTADMINANFFDHASSNGTSPAARLLASGFVPLGLGYALGENIAWGTGSLSTPAAIVNGWMHSPEHRANILNGAFSKSGIGVLASVPARLSSDPGAMYTQDFGAILG